MPNTRPVVKYYSDATTENLTTKFGALGTMRTFVLATILFSNTDILATKGFDLNVLPRGAEVTLPQPAVVFVPLDTRVTLSATGRPQSLKMTTHNLRQRKATALELAVYDPNSERVRYLKIKPDVPYVYSFKGLSTVMIIITAQGPAHRHQVLRVESDKSLKIAK